MSQTLPQLVDPDAPIFTVSVAANLSGMHPQTLRAYDRMGLVVPSRAKGKGRRYTPRDIGKLRLIQRLSQGEGINLNGIRRIIELQNELDAAQQRLDQMAALMRQVSAAHQPVTRVFTAGAQGDVDLGRHIRVSRPLALTSQPSSA